MVTIFALVLLLFNTLRPITGIKLDGNGYTDIIVAINPAVPENEALINQTKEMITSASEFLFQALDNIVFYKEVKIIVPPNWRGKYERARRETYDKANIIIDYPNPLYGDEPYTKQIKGCGEEGEHIHFTPDFLLKDHFVNSYGPRGRVFVHEWAHLRWGVFDEYNEKVPFYLTKDSKIQATRCVGEIKGRHYEVIDGEYLHCRSDDAGLPSKDCQFFPDKEQQIHASIMYMQSLDSVKAFCSIKDHNSDAPNMQNQKCDYKSTRTVIFQDSVDSDSFQTLKPLQSPPPHPTFKVIQRQNQVICLILDVSGSMQGERILRLQQAASIFLSEIVDEGAYVGIVKFSTNAFIVSSLTKIEGKPSRKQLISMLQSASANGYTNMCKGLDIGLKVLKQDDENTVGDYIIFLTDGEATDNVQDCLESAVDSGVIINTIAFGPEASDVLKTMANETGGKYIVAGQSLLSTQLVDAFSSFTMSDGDPSKETVQLVSTGSITTDWFNGTLQIDSTVGNSTTFTILYQTSTPTLYIEAPSGSVYGQSHITDNAATKTVTLNVPGTAEPGTWKYSFLNREPTAQTITLTVTSRAARDDVPPITVKTATKKTTSDGSELLVVFAEVSQNYLPVLGANVLATLKSDTRQKEVLQLLDNGAGADEFKDDGIYSRYFTKLMTAKYSLKVQVVQQGGERNLSPSTHSGALYVPGYIVNGEVVPNPPKPPVSLQSPDFGSFTRTATGESFVVSVPPGIPSPNFPPNKITDLRAEMQEDTLLLNWTAPGEDCDQGTVDSYEVRWSDSLEKLQNNFSNANPMNTSAIQPKQAGSNEEHSFLLDIIQNGTTLFFAVRSEDKEAAKSAVSNIARATKFVPRRSEIQETPGMNLTGIVVLVCVITVAFFIAAITTWRLKRKKCRSIRISY
ncbi:calcium-activated chloride channel regulator 4-like [Hoplias malabaricus]|uniref:calcium-activated chloride channel regulator 4-like n=1 Tax=Hoplias malabaricus TaxID=27720 RepID=UPI0034621E90